ncbi:hypothetical protein C8Q75DRAFT_557045 [Abortiporus biennis]|nr:hypothetical protein C8Q75DRAFT_557045 [Abortiporus biennis]
MSEKLAAQVAKLKDEGNALFTQKKFSEAHRKYTEAIRKDDKNAVLYANRAACCLSMKRYMDASKDALLAIEIDPNYSKAWARRATALEVLSQDDAAIHCWRKAIATLPKQNLTAAELQQKEQYEKQLAAALRRIEDLEAHPTEAGSPVLPALAPWIRAQTLREEIRSQGPAGLNSSVWVILGAYDEFNEGSKKLMAQRYMNVPGVGLQVVAAAGALQNLSNGIMRDSRIFYLSSMSWIDSFNKQILFECEYARAWKDGGATFVKEQALKRQREEGFDGVRRSLSVTLRHWLLLGFLEGRIKGNYGTEIEYLTRVIEVLDWGRKVWRDVSEDDKGVIFLDSFYMGVRAMLMQAYMYLHAENPGPNAKVQPKVLLEEAQNFLQEFENISSPSKNPDPGFCSSFYIYPKGQAYASMAYAYGQMSHIAIRKRERNKVILDFCDKAAKGYLKAASYYPTDDENHVWFLNCALEFSFSTSTPVRGLLPIMERIRLAIPEMKKIWQFSALAKTRDKSLNLTLKAEENIRKGLKSGKVKMGDVGTLDR